MRRRKANQSPHSSNALFKEQSRWWQRRYQMGPGSKFLTLAAATPPDPAAFLLHRHHNPAGKPGLLCCDLSPQVPHKLFTMMGADDTHRDLYHWNGRVSTMKTMGHFSFCLTNTNYTAVLTKGPSLPCSAAWLASGCGSFSSHPHPPRLREPHALLE